MSANILIAGDSFGADWSPKYNDYAGWPTLLKKLHNVKNVCQAGCSEYKIRNQIVGNISNTFTHCIVVHTNPYRLPTKHNPLHLNDKLHHNCDFIYSDVENANNPETNCIKEYYENFFYDEYYEYTHSLIINDIVHLTSEVKTLHITFFDYHHRLISRYFHPVFKNNPGLINHLSAAGNKIILNEINDWVRYA